MSYDDDCRNGAIGQAKLQELTQRMTSGQSTHEAYAAVYQVDQHQAAQAQLGYQNLGLGYQSAAVETQAIGLGQQQGLCQQLKFTAEQVMEYMAEANRHRPFLVAHAFGTDDWIREWNAASAKNPYVFVNADNPVDDSKPAIDYFAITREVSV